jgi:hypothetical protein
MSVCGCTKMRLSMMGMCEWGRERRNLEGPPGRSLGASGMIMLGTLRLSIGILG